MTFRLFSPMVMLMPQMVLASGVGQSCDSAALRAAEATRGGELAAMAAADVVLVVSDEERAQLAQDAPGLHVEVLSNLHRIAGPGADFDARRDLVFVGGFRHPPNVDAVLWFAGEVLPKIRQRLPQVRFHCIGSDPPAQVRARVQASARFLHPRVLALN